MSASGENQIPPNPPFSKEEVLASSKGEIPVSRIWQFSAFSFEKGGRGRIFEFLKWLLPVTGLLLASCGFHLRSSSDLPPVMQRTYLVVPAGNNDLVRELRRSLSTDTISLTDDPDKATATLTVLSARQFTRVLSVSNIGRPVEEEVAYQVQFSLATPAGILIAPQTLILKRNYAYDEANVLGDAEQANVLYAALQRNMAQLILFRVEALNRPAGPTPSH